MSRTKVTAEDAIVRVRMLTERIRNALGHPLADDGTGSITFFKGGLGGLSLSGGEATQFRECIDTLVQVFGSKNPELAPLSKRAAEDHLQRALLRVVRGCGKSRRRSQRFLAAQRQALADLRAALEATPQEWVVTGVVGGIEASTLPFRFAGVAFAPGTPENVQGLAAAALPRFKPPSGMSAQEVAKTRRDRAAARKRINREFRRHTMAVVGVLAFDADAAHAVGLDRIRRAIDALNFFAPFDRRSQDSFVFLASDSPFADLAA